MTLQNEFFTQEICDSLAGKLDNNVVKTRKLYGSSGPELSYVEGWWVIQEANRIFGYGAWIQEIVDLKCVCDVRQDDVKRGYQGKPDTIQNRAHVSYVATVRITVGGVVREDVGSGHGIDAETGGAHESASKEAITDAMKRAFRTFGYTFGLALYDKDQKNVATDEVDLLASDKTEFTKYIVNMVAEKKLTTLGRDTVCAMVNAPNLKAIDEKFRAPILKALSDAGKLLLINQGKHPKTGVQLVEDPIAEKEEEKIEDLEAAVAEVI